MKVKKLNGDEVTVQIKIDALTFAQVKKWERDNEKNLNHLQVLTGDEAANQFFPDLPKEKANEITHNDLWDATFWSCGEEVAEVMKIITGDENFDIEGYHRLIIESMVMGFLSQSNKIA